MVALLVDNVEPSMNAPPPDETRAFDLVMVESINTPAAPWSSIMPPPPMWDSQSSTCKFDATRVLSEEKIPAPWLLVQLVTRVSNISCR